MGIPQADESLCHHHFLYQNKIISFQILESLAYTHFSKAQQPSRLYPGLLTSVTELLPLHFRLREETAARVPMLSLPLQTIKDTVYRIVPC